MAVHFNNSHKHVGKQATRATGRGCCTADSRRGNGGRCCAGDQDEPAFPTEPHLLILQTTSFSLKQTRQNTLAAITNLGHVIPFLLLGPPHHLTTQWVREIT